MVAPRNDNPEQPKGHETPSAHTKPPKPPTIVEKLEALADAIRSASPLGAAEASYAMLVDQARRGEMEDASQIVLVLALTGHPLAEFVEDVRLSDRRMKHRAFWLASLACDIDKQTRIATAREAVVKQTCQHFMTQLKAKVDVDWIEAWRDKFAGVDEFRADVQRRLAGFAGQIAEVVGDLGRAASDLPTMRVAEVLRASADRLAREAMAAYLDLVAVTHSGPLDLYGYPLGS